MDAVFKKLNLKDQTTVIILNAPDSFEGNMDSIRDQADIVTSLDGILEIEFVMVFVTKQTEIDAVVPKIAPLLKGDAILWMCYPKGTSRKYKCDFNRDTGWKVMVPYDLETVRMVAIDEDWSALRFKKVEFIKSMNRTSLETLSEKGKLKSGK